MRTKRVSMRILKAYFSLSDCSSNRFMGATLLGNDIGVSKGTLGSPICLGPSRLFECHGSSRATSIRRTGTNLCAS